MIRRRIRAPWSAKQRNAGPELPRVFLGEWHRSNGEVDGASAHCRVCDDEPTDREEDRHAQKAALCDRPVRGSSHAERRAMRAPRSRTDTGYAPFAYPVSFQSGKNRYLTQL
jgi:hypothetical protein